MRTVEGQHSVSDHAEILADKERVSRHGAGIARCGEGGKAAPSLVVDAAGIVRAGGGEVAFEFGIDLLDRDDGVHEPSLMCWNISFIRTR